MIEMKISSAHNVILKKFLSQEKNSFCVPELILKLEPLLGTYRGPVGHGIA